MRIAVILPCLNEGATIGGTVAGFRAALPGGAVYVYDNNSSDGTAAAARAAGAVVRTERMQGKGHVVRRMFADVEAEVYVLADGDGTYEAAAAGGMVRMLCVEGLDMVVGARRPAVQAAYRRGHRVGNAVLTGLLARLFGRHFTDVLSGYRVFSRRFVKSFPVLSSGFEIETEISVHALALRMPVGEVVTDYAARAEGSHSKLSTWRDGWRILRTIVALYRFERPLLFFGWLGWGLIAIALAAAWPVFVTYAQTGLVPRLPTALLATAIVLVAFLAFVCGLILDTVARGRQEMRRLAYLGLPAPPDGEG